MGCLTAPNSLKWKEFHLIILSPRPSSSPIFPDPTMVSDQNMKGPSYREHNGTRFQPSPGIGACDLETSCLNTPSDPVKVPLGHLPIWQSEQVGGQYLLPHGGPILAGLSPGALRREDGHVASRLLLTICPKLHNSQSNEFWSRGHPDGLGKCPRVLPVTQAGRRRRHSQIPV